MLHIIFVYIILNPNTALTFITMLCTHLYVFYCDYEIVCILYCNINVYVLTHTFMCACTLVCVYECVFMFTSFWIYLKFYYL